VYHLSGLECASREGVGVDAFSVVWHRITASQPVPQHDLIVGAAVVAGLVVLVRATWEPTRHLVTIVHEGAHGLVAAVTGRKLAGIRLHSDSSGVTVSRGKPRGPGMVATAAAGYLGPALLGLLCAWLLDQGHAVAVLWLLLVLLAALLLQIRNIYGFFVVVAVGVALFLVSWRLDVQKQVAVAYLVTWFLLLAAPRPVWELQAARRRGRARASDADQLGRLTPLPAIAWVGFFLLVTLGSLVVGASMLLVR
jgi:hypothetical protein